jgi:predicted lipid-binding transport protein (Tim44 family)
MFIMAADRSSTVPGQDPDDGPSQRGGQSPFAGLPAYPDHPDTSPPAYPPHPVEIAGQRWSRVGRILGRVLGGLAGGLAGGLDAWDRWGLLGLIAGAVAGAFVLGFLVGEVIAFSWGLRSRWFAAWRLRRAQRLGDPLTKEEDPAWDRVRSLLREQRGSDNPDP